MYNNIFICFILSALQTVPRFLFPHIFYNSRQSNAPSSICLFYFLKYKPPTSAQNFLRSNGTTFLGKVRDGDDLFAKILSQKNLKFCFRLSVKKWHVNQKEKTTLYCNHILKYFILDSNLDMQKFRQLLDIQSLSLSLSLSLSIYIYMKCFNM